MYKMNSMGRREFLNAKHALHRVTTGMCRVLVMCCLYQVYLDCAHNAL